MIKNTLDKIWENCKNNRTVILLMCVFCCAALIMNSTQIAQTVAALQGDRILEQEEESETETETWTETETEPETESPEEILFREETAKREKRKLFSRYGESFRVPMYVREAAEAEETEKTETEKTETEKTETEKTETEAESSKTEIPETETPEMPEGMTEIQIKTESEDSKQYYILEYVQQEDSIKNRLLKRYELPDYQILSLDFLVGQDLLPAGIDPEMITVPGVKTFVHLERLVEEEIAGYDGDWSVYVKNLSTNESFVLNDRPMKSASVMKLFIMGTVYKAFESGELERTEEIMSLVRNMISYSDNPSSNELLFQLGDGSYEDGIAEVDAFIQEFGFSEMTVEYNGFNNPDTNTSDELFNQVAARDCGKLLEDIYRRNWTNRSVSNEIETMLLTQNTRYKIPDGLPDDVSCGNKTGEMEFTENDAAIIYGPKCDYILVVLSSDWSSKNEAISRIRDISSMVYEYLNE